MNPHIPAEWALDREIVLTRVFDSPSERVFAAWTGGDAMGAWFGPGFQTLAKLDVYLRQ